MARRQPTPEACRAAAQLGRTVDVALGESELTPAGYRLLANLLVGGTAATVLAEKLAVSRPTVTATIQWLENRGFVTRSPDRSDRRRVAIEITDAGAAAVAEADALVGARLMEVLASLDEVGAGEVLAALDRLLGALNDFRARRHERGGAS